ncbi:MAG: hypothetical protein FWD67_04135 [Betaproteobacteria bacterium]|nr:hypothetical protein [Betaproteobacteria bacterium]
MVSKTTASTQVSGTCFRVQTWGSAEVTLCLTDSLLQRVITSWMSLTGKSKRKLIAKTHDMRNTYLQAGSPDLVKTGNEDGWCAGWPVQPGEVWERVLV